MTLPSNIIMMRERHLVNTDPQRRCYNGEHFSSELVWGGWTVLEYVDEKHIEERLKFWRDLNEYAVKERGESANAEFKVEAKA